MITRRKKNVSLLLRNLFLFILYYFVSNNKCYRQQTGVDLCNPVPVVPTTLSILYVQHHTLYVSPLHFFTSYFLPRAWILPGPLDCFPPLTSHYIPQSRLSHICTYTPHTYLLPSLLILSLNNTECCIIIRTV